MGTAGPPVELYRRDAGTGPPVLLLHGLDQDHTVWNGQIPELVRTFRAVAPDLRGHGRTPSPAGSTFSFEELQGDVVRLLNELGLDRADVVGLSAGGFLALRLAVTLPARVSALVVISAAPHCDAHTRAVGESWAEAYATGGSDAYTLRVLKDAYSSDWIEAHMDFVDRMRDRNREPNLEGVVQWARAIREFDLRGRLGRITAPTLILHGMDDRIVDPSHARLLRQSIPGSQLKLFPQTGHMVPIEHPRETAEAIRDFLEQRTAVPSAPVRPASSARKE